jgi:hypothetical protein
LGEGVAPLQRIFCDLRSASMTRKLQSGKRRIGSRIRHLLAQE